MFGGYYQSRRVLVTGHSGFKGSWLSLWLKHLGASVFGLGLGPPTNPNLHELFHKVCFEREIDDDIRNLSAVKAAIEQVRPDIIFHLAAQPLVRHSYHAPVETFETNVLGTMNVLEAIRQLEVPCVTVMVTSDKCYENRGWDFGYRESDPLGGEDVYSASKAAAELAITAWRASFFKSGSRPGQIASARGGNVIGGGDYARDRIVPDCVRALLVHQPILLRRPTSTRPWQHVLDCLSGYLWLGACLARAKPGSHLASAFNFGPGPRANLPVSELVNALLKIWPGRWELHPEAVNDQSLPEANKLNLAIDKAAAQLDWFPALDLSDAIAQTVAWYYQRHVLKKTDMVEYSLGQIESYTIAARGRNLAWAALPT